MPERKTFTPEHQPPHGLAEAIQDTLNTKELVIVRSQDLDNPYELTKLLLPHKDIIELRMRIVHDFTDTGEPRLHVVLSAPNKKRKPDTKEKLNPIVYYSSDRIEEIRVDEIVEILGQDIRPGHEKIKGLSIGIFKTGLTFKLQT